MKFTTLLTLLSTSLLPSLAAAAAAATSLSERATGGYLQNPTGTASFTYYSGCGSPACGVTASGYTAAMSQLSFGAASGAGAGDACGRCFSLTASADPYSPSYTGPFKSVVVKITDLCPAPANEVWCGQTQATPTNTYGAAVHFDLCEDTGASTAFFPSGHGALTGTYSEVSCSGHWTGTDGSPLFTGACISGETAANWPSTACGNKGTAP